MKKKLRSLRTKAEILELLELAESIQTETHSLKGKKHKKVLRLAIFKAQIMEEVLNWILQRPSTVDSLYKLGLLHDPRRKHSK